MRIIPKKIKVKNTVWKCYSMADVIVALIVFAIIFIAITSGAFAFAVINPALDMYLKFQIPNKHRQVPEWKMLLRFHLLFQHDTRHPHKILNREFWSESAINPRFGIVPNPIQNKFFYSLRQFLSLRPLFSQYLQYFPSIQHFLYGAACGGNVYAYAGRHFLFVYLGKHQIPVCEKGLYRKRRQTKRTRGRALKPERHQGKRAYRIQRRVLRQSN